MSSAAAHTGPRWRRGTLLAVGLASSAFFLWLVVRDADLHAVWLALRGAELGPVLLAAVVIQGVYVAQAARWRIIAGTLELSVRRFYALVLGGIGANDVLPLRIGDLLRARWLATSAEIPTGRAFGSVFRDRLCDVLTLVVALVRLAAVRERRRLGGADRDRRRRPPRALSGSSSPARSCTCARGHARDGRSGAASGG